MQVDFKNILFKLLPQGSAISREDEKLMGFLESIGSVYAEVYRRLLQIIDFLPDKPNIWENRWKKLLGVVDPLHHFKAKGFAVSIEKKDVTKEHFEKLDFIVSNTKEHFEKLVDGIKVECRVNHIKISGIKNIKTPWRCGSPIGPLATYEHAGELKRKIELVKHAHIISEYEVIQNVTSH